MDAVEHYAKDWARREEVEVDCLSEWVKSIRRQLQHRTYWSVDQLILDQNQYLIILMLCVIWLIYMINMY